MFNNFSINNSRYSIADDLHTWDVLQTKYLDKFTGSQKQSQYKQKLTNIFEKG